MWQGNNTWMHYVHSAVFLASFLRFSGISKNYASSLEVIDLQKYKLIKHPEKVKLALRDRVQIPFVFVVGKN